VAERKIDMNSRVIKASLSYRLKLLVLLEQARFGQKIRGDNFWLTLGDLSDSIRLCDLIRRGEIKKAIECYEDMDTLPRENVPYKLIDALYKMDETE
jgi:hypothetical protein